MLGSAFGDRRTVFSSRFSSALMRFACLSPRAEPHRLGDPIRLVSVYVRRD
jgi:hypothetical protein